MAGRPRVAEGAESGDRRLSAQWVVMAGRRGRERSHDGRGGVPELTQRPGGRLHH